MRRTPTPISCLAHGGEYPASPTSLPDANVRRGATQSEYIPTDSAGDRSVLSRRGAVPALASALPDSIATGPRIHALCSYVNFAAYAGYPHPPSAVCPPSY